MSTRSVTMKSSLVVVVSACVVGLVPGSAEADTAMRTDRRGDAPASIDITRVTYRHAPARVAATIRVPRLDGPARASLAISRFTVFEAGYVAIVKKRRSGKLAKRLFYFNHFTLVPRRCRIGGSWNERASRVRITVPRRCLRQHQRKRLYLAARTMRGRAFDDARPVRRLRRG